MVTQRLEAESISVGLPMKPTKERRGLQAESDEHDLLHAALGVVYDDLEVVRSEGTSSLAAHAMDITVRARQLEREALRFGITQAFAITCSHYTDSIDLETMSLGFAPSYEAFKLDEKETAVAPLPWNLADKVQDIVHP